MSKANIIADFSILAQLWKKAKKNKAKEIVPGKDPMRLKAYQQAITALCTVPGDEILSIKVVKKGKPRPNRKGKAEKREVYITTDKVKNQYIPRSLGKATSDKIQEYLETGEMKAAQTARKWLQDHLQEEEKKNLSPKQRAMKAFLSITGVGEATAKAWLVKYRRSKSALSPIKWVRANAKQLKLTHTQSIGVDPEYYTDLKKRIPRHYIDIIQMIIRLAFTKTFGFNSYTMVVCGSYRRGSMDSGDIDILFKSKVFNLEQAVQTLIEWGVIVETINIGGGKFSGICHCPSGQWHYFHLDLFYSTEKEWGAQLLAWTGGAGFVRNMRQAANRKGYTLNQYGLFRSLADARARRNPVAINEKDILKKIDYPYVPPVCR